MDTIFTFKTDENIKNQASAIYEEMGLDLAAALNLFMRATVIKQELPISIDYWVKEDLLKTYPDYFLN